MIHVVPPIKIVSPTHTPRHLVLPPLHEYTVESVGGTGLYTWLQPEENGVFAIDENTLQGKCRIRSGAALGSSPIKSRDQRIPFNADEITVRSNLHHSSIMFLPKL